MRPDVLELIAEEVAGRPVDALASFVTWDDGRRKLDGMAKGRRWDIDREQRQWEKDNAADLARFVARRNWQRFTQQNPQRVKTAARKWVREHWGRLLAYRARWAKEHADREREYDRRQMANTRADPVRLARYQARQERHKLKKRAKENARYWGNVEASRERSRRNSATYYAKQPREGKRKCSLCRKPGHNVLRCQGGQMSRRPPPARKGVVLDGRRHGRLYL
jgi:hypothetical protein